MNFEFLIEDKSGEAMLEELVPKIIDTNKHSYRIISYKGIGSIPKGLKTSQDASKRALLNQLPKLLGLDKLQNNNGIALNIENFNNNTDKDIEYLANELAFYIRRKSIGMGGAY